MDTGAALPVSRFELLSAAGQAHTQELLGRRLSQGPPPQGRDWEGGVLALTWLGLFLSPAWISPASVNPRHPHHCLGLPRGQRLEMDLVYSRLPLHEGAWSACGPAVLVHSWVLDASARAHTFTVTPPLPQPHPTGRALMKSETFRGGWCSPSPLPFTLPPNKACQWGTDALHC